MIEYLADSDCLIDYLKGKDATFSLLAPLIQKGSLATSIIVYAEVYEGLLHAGAREAYRQLLVDVIAGVPVIGLDIEIGQLFAAARAELRRQGQLIPDHDLWIAATALRHQLTIISSDRHFERIPGLKRLQPEPLE